MNTRKVQLALTVLGVATLAVTAAGTQAVPPSPPWFTWTTVVNNGDFMPTDLCVPTAPATPPCRTFNSYNQPSINANQVVVIRARSRGGQGGQAVHGVYTRDMATTGPVVRILDRSTQVPQPNNLSSTFIEPPSFPRIDIGTDTVAARGNHQPVWRYFLDDDTETRAGTTGIYTNPFGDLITGASKLGAVPDFSFFEVPEAPGTPFDVFPGAAAVTDGATIAFKGNYPVDGVGKTGVYYRDLENAPILSSAGNLEPAGGSNPIILIANSLDTFIPGTGTIFGSTAPPSAANRQMVFAGFDNEDKPTLGGIYLAPLNGTTQPPLRTLVAIGGQVPGENSKARFNRLGEGASFDGRFVAFWGAWGTEKKTLVLRCRTEGNQALLAFCNKQHPNGFETTVPVNQGIFVHDLRTKQTQVVAKTPTDYDDFVYWNFSGRTPGTGEGDDNGELARWRSASFVAVSGLVDRKLTDATFHAAFKARTGDVVSGAYTDPVDGIYLRKGSGKTPLLTLVETGMDGILLDPEAIDAFGVLPLPVTEMGLERDGFRGNSLVINASMGTEETGWAGIYLTEVPE
ncbi:conserved exported hypothetical protein [Thiocapsa sp. KS1]|nr:hypothetical protein [Thiocapsa sp. KS1]CRI62902.1 conserved exported hypothetical protein [Thiocapsa sp. KS1]